MVPLTVGSRKRDHDETSLVIFFAHDQQTMMVRKVIAEMDKNSEIELIKTRNVQLQVKLIHTLWKILY